MKVIVYETPFILTRWHTDTLDCYGHSRNHHVTPFSTGINAMAVAATTSNTLAGLSTNTAPEIIDFIVELVAEIERLQTEITEITDMVIEHNDNINKRLGAILAQIRVNRGE